MPPLSTSTPPARRIFGLTMGDIVGSIVLGLALGWLVAEWIDAGLRGAL
jgi:hypothetical protein